MSLFNRQSEMERSGYIPDPVIEEDPRTLEYVPPAGGEIPKELLLPDSGWVTNQKGRSSCTCNSFAHLVADEYGWQPSVRFPFSIIRTDSEFASSKLTWGAYTTDSLKLMQKRGIPRFDLAPDGGNSGDDKYIQDFVVTEEMLADAKKNKGGAYMTIQRGGNDLDKFDKIKEYIGTEKKGALIVVRWNKAYNSRQNPTGIIPLKSLTSGFVGYHQIYANGYKEINNHEYIRAKNSYGKGWGDNGYVWIPKGFVQLGTPVGWVGPERSKELGYVVEKPKVRIRDARQEKRYWEDFWMFVNGLWFPLNVNKDARKANQEVRDIMVKEKLRIVNALTYYGWTPIDIKNHYYARSRGKTNTKAYNLIITANKPLS